MTGTQRRRALSTISALYLVAVAIVALLLNRFADVIWPATVIAFAPRWIWAAPLVLLISLTVVDRGERTRAETLRIFAPLAAAALLLFGPILDLRVPVVRIARGLGGAPPRDLRVMTYNVGGGSIDPEAFSAMVDRIAPDVITIQERTAELAGPTESRLAYSGRCGSEQCLWSRFPIDLVEARDRTDLLAKHGSGGMVRYVVRTPRGPIDVINVHLATVRDGLSAVMHRGWRGAPALEENTRLRALESEIAHGFADRGGGPESTSGAASGQAGLRPAPLLVMGDFNMPIESAIYRQWWGSYTNALSAAGLGFGETKRTRWHGVRIDHVLAGPGWEVLAAWVGEGLGGDHRPVFADLRWVGP